MGIFNKLFGDKSKSGAPDNTRLLELLEIYRKENGKGDSYKNVLFELLNGNSFLIFATKNDSETDPDKWTALQQETLFKMDSSLINVDGLKVLMVFTDKEALLSWCKKPSQQYTSMKSKDILEFARNNDAGRIIINQGTPTMYIVERSKENIKEHRIVKDTKIMLGTLAKFPNNTIIEKLKENFKKDQTISEAYQYGQSKDGEFSMVIAFKLAVNSSNAKTAAINAVRDAIQNQKLEQPLDIFFIESQDWYDRITKIEKSLLYKN